MVNSIKEKAKIKQCIKKASGKAKIIESVEGLNNQASLLKNNSWKATNNSSKFKAIIIRTTNGTIIPIWNGRISFQVNLWRLI